MISVVMASYNGERYITTQLESILNQELPPEEVIISDDCSTDRTVSIIEKFIKDNNLLGWKLYTNETNVGFSHNFMNAVSQATGDYIFFADQDDIWIETKISEMMNIIVSRDEINTLSCRYTLIDAHGKTMRTNYWIELDEKVHKIDFKSYLTQWGYPGMSMVVRREFLDKVIDHLPKSYIAHDFATNLVAVAKGSMYCYAKSLVLYRQHSSNAIGVNYNLTKDYRFTLNERLDYIEKNIKHLEKAGEILEAYDDMELTGKQQQLKFIKRRFICYHERKRILEKGSVFGAIGMIRYLSSYPMFRVYISDIWFCIKRFMPEGKQ